LVRFNLISTLTAASRRVEHHLVIFGGGSFLGPAIPSRGVVSELSRGEGDGHGAPSSYERERRRVSQPPVPDWIDAGDRVKMGFTVPSCNLFHWSLKFVHPLPVANGHPK
jgi:hypothetical protein